MRKRQDLRLTAQGGLLLGACADAAARTGLPPLLFRAVVLISACLWFKLTVALYCLGAIAGRLRR